MKYALTLLFGTDARGADDCAFHPEVPSTCDGSLAYDYGSTALGAGPEYCQLTEDLVHWCSTHFQCDKFASRCPDFEAFVANSLQIGDDDYNSWVAGRCAANNGRIFDLIVWQFSIDYYTREYALFDPDTGQLLGSGGFDTAAAVRCCGDDETPDESWVGEYIPFAGASTCDLYDNAYWRDKLGLWPEPEHTADTAAPTTDDRGCRCSSTGPAPWLVAPLLALALRRRRRC